MAEQETKFQYEPNVADKEQGIAHPDIEQFKNRPYGSVARECGQNSNDAASTWNPRTQPVEMSFDLIQIRRDEYPSYEQHVETMRRCLNQSNSGSGDTKAQEFFTRALKVMNETKIPVLLIKDVKTTGTAGPPDKKYAPWKVLLKGVGQSAGKQVDAGGNFGIGKGAAYAASETYTVFYSTIYVDPSNGQQHFLAQGRTRLISHKDSEGNDVLSDGYWGLPNRFMPVQDQALVPDWLRRTEVGTTVAIVGFREKTDWQWELAMSLIMNFFVAVTRQEIIFSINKGQIQIDHSTIAGLFDDKEIERVCDTEKLTEEFNFAKSLYECLTSPDSLDEEMDIKGLGKIGLRVLVRDGLIKKLKIVRNGMSITENLKEFGDSFSRFPSYRDFVALVEAKDEAARVAFRKMENPEHDDLSVERIHNLAIRAELKTAMTTFAAELRKKIKAIAAPKLEHRTTLTEMAKYFPSEQAENNQPGESPKENPEKHIYLPTPPKKIRPQQPLRDTKPGEEGGSAGTGRGGSGKGGTGEAKGKGKGGAGTKGQSIFLLEDIRNFLPPKTSGWDREVRFTPNMTGLAEITISAPGVSEPVQLELASCDGHSTQQGRARMKVCALQRAVLRVRFKTPYAGPIEVTAVRIKR